MKILVDTNIYVASMRFAGVRRKLIWKILEDDHTVVLTDFIIAELRIKFSEMYDPDEAAAALDNLLEFLGTGHVEVKTYGTTLALSTRSSFRSELRMPRSSPQHCSLTSTTL